MGNVSALQKEMGKVDSSQDISNDILALSALPEGLHSTLGFSLANY